MARDCHAKAAGKPQTYVPPAKGKGRGAGSLEQEAGKGDYEESMLGCGSVEWECGNLELDVGLDVLGEEECEFDLMGPADYEGEEPSHAEQVPPLVLGEDGWPVDTSVSTTSILPSLERIGATPLRSHSLTKLAPTSGSVPMSSSSSIHIPSIANIHSATIHSNHIHSHVAADDLSWLNQGKQAVQASKTSRQFSQRTYIRF